MRSRVLWAAVVAAALCAVLVASTCGDERATDTADRETAPDGTTGADSESHSPRERHAVPTAVTRRPRVRAAAPAEDESAPAVVEERRFHEPVAQWETEKRIDLAGERPGVLVAKWCAMSDSGVELERLSDGKTLWRVHVQPLGIEHSKYHQDVTVRVEGDRVVVESVGAQKIVEVRDLETGAQTSRDVTDVVR